MRIIEHKGTVIGIHITRDIEPGTKPLTNDSEPLQVLSHNRPAGDIVISHYHKKISRNTDFLQEGIVLLDGLIEVDIFTEQKYFIETIKIKAGESFILQNGGWGIRIIEDSKMIEFKNGPYMDDRINLETLK